MLYNGRSNGTEGIPSEEHTASIKENYLAVTKSNIGSEYCLFKKGLK